MPHTLAVKGPTGVEFETKAATHWLSFFFALVFVSLETGQSGDVQRGRAFFQNLQISSNGLLALSEVGHCKRRKSFVFLSLLAL